VRSLANEVVASLARASTKYDAAIQAAEADVRDSWHSRAWREMHRTRGEAGVEGQWWGILPRLHWALPVVWYS
jgi:hypothetical protein